MQASMANQKSTEASIKNLETQMGQLAKQISDQSASTSFSPTTQVNPKEHCKAITTRSGRVVEEKNKGVEGKDQVVNDEDIDEEIVVEEVLVEKNDENVVVGDVEVENNVVVENDVVDNGVVEKENVDDKNKKLRR